MREFRIRQLSAGEFRLEITIKLIFKKRAEINFREKKKLTNRLHESQGNIPIVQNIKHVLVWASAFFFWSNIFQAKIQGLYKPCTNKDRSEIVSLGISSSFLFLESFFDLDLSFESFEFLLIFTISIILPLFLSDLGSNLLFFEFLDYLLLSTADCELEAFVLS